ncbi:hypothetical protein [Lacunimicrobium album]
MTETVFVATESFGPQNDQRWLSYFEWAKIPQLKEVVSLDGLLNPHLVVDLIDDDWDHIVNADFRLSYFKDLPYLLSRIPKGILCNVLGLYRNPEYHILKPPAAGSFVFLGYDLIDDQCQISALTNCGGFPESFSNDQLNQFGLITDFQLATSIRRKLRENNPHEPHAKCELYAIWRLNEQVT